MEKVGQAQNTIWLERQTEALGVILYQVAVTTVAL